MNKGFAVYEGGLPQCLNGEVIASAEGYESGRNFVSSNEDDFVFVVLQKKYNLSLDLGEVDKALVSFVSDNYSSSVVYPEVKSIELVEGYYNVSVSVYENSSLKFPEINRRECVDVPESGVSGLFGLTTEKCYDINIPEMNVDYAVIGGGITSEYFTFDMLKNSQELNINVPIFSKPSSLEELQKNQLAVESEQIYLDLE
jgi:hypothetical protein